MREVSSELIVKGVKEMCISSNINLPKDVYKSLKDFKEKEESEVGKEVLDQLIQNADIAANEQMPICQDTGFAVLFVTLGQDVQVTGQDLAAAINEGVRQGYIEGYLRKSIVSDPFDRQNTKDNTPAIIHTELVPGDTLEITMAPKGGGSENMSQLKMFPPSAGRNGVVDFVLESVSDAGPNPCPPIVVGVGIGGTFEKVAMLAKKALLRDIGSINPDPAAAELEAELLERINKLGIGPQGLGGRTTALAVFVEKHPCHLASMPAAVNINCHAARHEKKTF